MSDECATDRGDSAPKATLSESEIDEALGALADEHCRHFLGFLIRECPTPVAAATAVDHVADATDTSRERVRTILHHNYWPRLESAGLVEYDPATDALSYAGGEFCREVLRLTEATSGRSYVPPEESGE